MSEPNSSSADTARGGRPGAGGAPGPASAVTELMSALLEASFDGLIVVEAGSDTIVDLNPTACELLGDSRIDLLGRSVSELLDQAGAMTSWGDASQPPAPGEVLQEAVVLKRADGSLGTVELRRSERQIGSERWALIAARALEVDEEPRRLAAAFDSIADGVIAADREGRVIHMNRAAETMTGWSQALAIGQGLQEVMPIREPNSSDVLELVRPIVESGVVMVLADRARMRQREGSSIAVEGVAAPLHDGGGVPGGVVVVFRDWTHEHRAREQLRRSEESFRALIEALPVALWVVRDEEVIYTNSTARALAPATENSNDTPSLLELIHPSDRERYRQHRASPTERAQPLELRFGQPEGNIQVVELSTLPMVFGGKPALAVVGRDLTDRHRMAAHLKMTERMLSLGTLAAGVAHEINNPLTFVLSNLDMLERMAMPGNDVVDAAQVAELVGEAKIGASRISRVVRDLSSFTRGDASKTQLVDVRRALDSAIAMSGNEIRHRATLDVCYPDTLSPVRGNEARLAQALLNLLLNAAQSLPDGEANDHPIRVVVEEQSGQVRLELTDSGSGIPSSIQDQVFDPFFTTRAVGDGMGLGLTICHSIITSMGGRIHFESGAGRGTCFHIELPVAGLENLSSRPPRPTLAPGSGPLRILIVDDEPIVGRALRRLLSGHTTQAVSSGRKALEALEQASEPFDVVICDMMMPEMSGPEVYAQVQRLDPELASRMVFMTGGAFSHQAREFLDGRPERWFDKPFVRSRVLALVDAAAARDGDESS